MDFRSMIEEKREWRALQARVKALPHDYQIVYKELQKYLFKVGAENMDASMEALYSIVDLFGEGATTGKPVLEITGPNPATFADALLESAGQKV